MKRMSVCLTVLLIVMSLFAVHAEDTTVRDVVLLTEYQQMGWGERFQIGMVDSEGNLWYYESPSRGDVPYEQEDLLVWAETSREPEMYASLSETELTDLLSLVQSVPAQEVIYQSGACDAGTQSSLAIRKDTDGTAEIILLGVSGDSTYENTDPTAQALYQTLRRLFAGVTDYEGEIGMSPVGFQETDILTFCGYDGMDLTKLTMIAYANDCEDGAAEIDPPLTADQILSMTVTGKRNSLATTGNTVTYRFLDSDGGTVAEFEFFGELLVRSDGMYSIGN